MFGTSVGVSGGWLFWGVEGANVTSSVFNGREETNTPDVVGTGAGAEVGIFLRGWGSVFVDLVILSGVGSCVCAGTGNFSDVWADFCWDGVLTF